MAFSSQLLEDSEIEDYLGAFMEQPYELLEKTVELWRGDFYDEPESQIIWQQEKPKKTTIKQPVYKIEETLNKKRKLSNLFAERKVNCTLQGDPGWLMRKTSAHLGVCWNKTKSKWRARVSNKGKREFLGDFDTEEAAACAVRARLDQLYKYV